MIPVTSFAGKTVAVFGLGGSGLASCHALKAGGAEVIASDDSADKLAEAAQAGFITADLRKVSWTNFREFQVLRPDGSGTFTKPGLRLSLASNFAALKPAARFPEGFCRPNSFM